MTKHVAPVSTDEVVVILATGGATIAFFAALSLTQAPWFPSDWAPAGFVVAALCVIVALAVRGITRPSD